MHCFVAFFEGINVGGHIVVKEKLQEAFNSLAFKTFLPTSKAEMWFSRLTLLTLRIKTKIEEKLASTLGYKVAVFVRTFIQLEAIISLDPLRAKIGKAQVFW